MKKYKNKYRTTSKRLQNWDYGWPGAYFITISTNEKAHYFGEVVHKKMELSTVGVVADILWHEIKNHATQIELGEFVAMPNHIHGILFLRRDKVEVEDVDRGLAVNGDSRTIGEARFQNQGKNTVSSIIGGYKSAVTKHANRLGFEFGWQSSFWDYVIRDEADQQRISNYIINNPQKWADDKFNGGVGNVVLEPWKKYGV